MKDDRDDHFDRTPELIGVLTDILIVVGALFALGAFRC